MSISSSGAESGLLLRTDGRLELNGQVMVNGQSLNGLIRQIVLAILGGGGREGAPPQNGDYVPDGLGGFRRLTGGEALCSGSCSAWSRGGGFPLYAGAGQPPLSGAPGETGSPTGAGGAVEPFIYAQH